MSDELKHYGVKGMKWGVRRALGVRARAAAINNSFIKGADKNIKRMENKKAKKGLTNRQVKYLEKNKQLKKKYTDVRNELIKDLSPKDIKRGERAVLARSLLGASKGILDSIDYVRGNNELKRMRNR